MRFMLHQAEVEKKLQVYLWSEPFGFEATPDEKKISRFFAFSEEGLAEAIDWMNEQYEEITKQQPTGRYGLLFFMHTDAEWNCAAIYAKPKPSGLQPWINEKLFWKHNSCDIRLLL